MSRMNCADVQNLSTRSSMEYGGSSGYVKKLNIIGERLVGWGIDREDPDRALWISVLTQEW